MRFQTIYVGTCDAYAAVKVKKLHLSYFGWADTLYRYFELREYRCLAWSVKTARVLVEVIQRTLQESF